jgi:DNA-binding Lrp family transcriptional regulator
MGILRKLGLFGGRKAEPDLAKSFKERQSREAAFDTRDRGTRLVPLERIVGSVGRYNDFDDRFRMRPHMPSDRLQHIKNAMRAGKALPPVKLYQIKNEYYVTDGNHRIAAAKELGRQEIRARILEFIPSRDSLENLVYRERSDFEDRTGLSAEIEITEIGQYERLLGQISRHREALAAESGRQPSLPEAAADWYRSIYRPLTAIIAKGRLLEHFPGRKAGDLYVYVSTHLWETPERQRRFGIGLSRQVPADMEEFRRRMAQLGETEYPEMLREITAFILVSVEVRKERAIIDKLFALDEVREVHSVHGSYDIIAKVVLQRNLVTSDARTIGDFLHRKIRQISGIQSTETLIPGYSRQASQIGFRPSQNT